MPRFTVLEPMSIGDVIDRAIRLYRHNFIALVAIAAVPTLSGYVVSLMFWDTFISSTLPSQGGGGGGDVGGVILFALLGYPLWIILLVATIAGLSRVVGDQVMMGEAVSFRKWFGYLWGRRGDMIKLGLLSILLLFAITMVVGIAMGIIIQIVGAIVALFMSSSMPTWFFTTLSVILGIIAAGAFVVVLFFVLSRIAFLPQVVMIEGSKPASAVSRAGFLGRRNWNKLAAIALFAYFVRLSLFAAFSVPTGLIYLFSGVSIENLFTDQTWSMITTSFWEMAGLLSLPIWAVSLTLLYFDNRVRKEAYDLQLLAGEVAPQRAAPAFTPAPAFGYQTYSPFGYRPDPIQTSPLGLSGIAPVRQAPLPPPPAQARPAAAACARCGAALGQEARFCSSCGLAVG